MIPSPVRLAAIGTAVVCGLVFLAAVTPPAPQPTPPAAPTAVAKPAAPPQWFVSHVPDLPEFQCLTMSASSKNPEQEIGELRKGLETQNPGVEHIKASVTSDESTYRIIYTLDWSFDIKIYHYKQHTLHGYFRNQGDCKAWTAAQPHKDFSPQYSNN